MGRPYQFIQTKYFTVMLAVYMTLQLTDQPCEAEILSADSAERIQIIGSCSGTTALVVDKDAADQIKRAADHVKFLQLAARWKTETSTLSSITEMVLNPAYQNIIGMGDAAVPFVLSQIEAEGDDPDQWFWALQSITGVDPVHEEDAGNYRAMAQTWLNWGKDVGYEW
ncbi:MAG TPA: hypothetical protein VN924_02335 [Bryobacteraceae bacterium]|jgi:hypothetical protein|nr:hypothetical protein [Bryobacteraceae bacterium]